MTGPVTAPTGTRTDSVVSELRAHGHRQVVAVPVAAVEDDLGGRGEAASRSSLIVLPPWARDFDAQRRMQVTLETFGVAT